MPDVPKGICSRRYNGLALPISPASIFLLNYCRPLRVWYLAPGSTHAIDVHGIPVHSSRLDDLDLPSAPGLLWMDIEGYEGHALEGAKSLLSFGTPLVSESHPEFLARAGGLEAFKQALEGRRIFDRQADI
jgi:hypothetical protein